MLEAMTRDDRNSLLMVTSTQMISVSSKLLQVFSPLYRDILRDIPSKDNDPVTLIVPGTEAVHVQHLLDLVTSGKIKKTNRGSFRDIVSLAECFKIDLKESDVSDMDFKSPPMIKVKNLGEMSSMAPSKSHNEEGSKKPDSNNFPDVINIDDRIEVGDDNIEDKCSFCSETLRGGRKSVRKHERRCKNRPDAPVCSICFNKISGGSHSLRRHEKRCRQMPNKCRLCGREYSGQLSLFNHMRARHFKNLPLFHCSSCNLRFMEQMELKNHILDSHFKRPTYAVYKFPEIKEPPSSFFETENLYDNDFFNETTTLLKENITQIREFHSSNN